MSCREVVAAPDSLVRGFDGDRCALCEADRIRAERSVLGSLQTTPRAGDVWERGRRRLHLERPLSESEWLASFYRRGIFGGPFRHASNESVIPDLLQRDGWRIVIKIGDPS